MCPKGGQLGILENNTDDYLKCECHIVSLRSYTMGKIANSGRTANIALCLEGQVGQESVSFSMRSWRLGWGRVNRGVKRGPSKPGFLQGHLDHIPSFTVSCNPLIKIAKTVTMSQSQHQLKIPYIFHVKTHGVQTCVIFIRPPHLFVI